MMLKKIVKWRKSIYEHCDFMIFFQRHESFDDFAERDGKVNEKPENSLQQWDVKSRLKKAKQCSEKVVNKCAKFVI